MQVTNGPEARHRQMRVSKRQMWLWVAVTVAAAFCMYSVTRFGFRLPNIGGSEGERSAGSKQPADFHQTQRTAAKFDLNSRSAGQVSSARVEASVRPSVGRATLAELEGADRSRSNLLNAALSPAEAEWMDRNGVPAPSDAASGYMNLSVEQLAQMAKEGDTRAATIGAQKAKVDAYDLDVGHAVIEGIASPPGSDRSTDNWHEREDAARALFASPQWQEQRDILWDGAVHGSNFSAEMMARTYMDIGNVCYAPVKCAAWLLVAWRMGQWDVTTQVEYVIPPGEHASLSSNLREANAIWARINAARHALRLAPLQIDLRPSFGVWQQLEQQRIEGDAPISVPVYSR